MVWSNELSRLDSTQGKEVFSSQKKMSRFSRAPVSYSEGCGSTFREGTAAGCEDATHTYLELKLRVRKLLYSVMSS